MYMYMYMLNIIVCQWCHWCQELIQLTFESLVVNRLREMKAVRSREKADSRVHHLEGVICESERKMSKMEEDLVQVTKVWGRGGRDRAGGGGGGGGCRGGGGKV